jgi:chromosome segregation ATPase
MAATYHHKALNDNPKMKNPIVSKIIMKDQITDLKQELDKEKNNHAALAVLFVDTNKTNANLRKENEVLKRDNTYLREQLVEQGNRWDEKHQQCCQLQKELGLLKLKLESARSRRDKLLAQTQRFEITIKPVSE